MAVGVVYSLSKMWDDPSNCLHVFCNSALILLWVAVSPLELGGCDRMGIIPGYRMILAVLGMPSWESSPFECAVLDIDSSVYPLLFYYIVRVQSYTIITLCVFYVSTR